MGKRSRDSDLLIPLLIGNLPVDFLHPLGYKIIMYHPACIAKNTYAKHDKFKVGVFLETDSFGISKGNVQFGNSERLTMCAETLALVEAKSNGLKPLHCHIVTDSDDLVFPCGICLQYAAEYPNMRVTAYNRNGSKKETKLVKELFPLPYSRPTK